MEETAFQGQEVRTEHLGESNSEPPTIKIFISSEFNPLFDVKIIFRYKSLQWH